MMRSWVLALVAVSMWGPARAAGLSGRVIGQDSKPVERATVLIYEAAPRKGTSPFCPTCYLDCGKVGSTDASGRFSIPTLDEKLLFRVLVVAAGFAPRFVESVDPRGGEMTARLTPRDLSRAPASSIVRGTVTDAEGESVPAALLEPVGYRRGRHMMFGRIPGDPLSVTDSSGRFALVALPGVDLFVKVRARGFAPQVFPDVLPGWKPEAFQLTRGVTVSGEVEESRGPVPGAAVGLVQADRAAETFVGPFEVGTDELGRFAITGVTPGQEYFLYGKMESLGAKGSLPARRIRLRSNGTALDLGSLDLQRGYSVSGRVLLPVGRAVPEGAGLLLSRADAWDSASRMLGSDGSFSVPGVPPETVRISVQVPGYRISSKTRFFDKESGGWPGSERLVLGVSTDLPGLEIILEPLPAAAGASSRPLPGSTP